ncbi:MAG: hypothetical protein HY698_17035 [Deltaproteobacteria bacterium]|nr:hypothetical protein [Deltaproteobacteria bacterium]
MKVQCEKCKEIVPLRFAVAKGAIEVSCASCGATYGVPATGTRPDRPASERHPDTQSPDSTRDATCPKCGEGQPQGDACRRCGLVFEKWHGILAAADASEVSLAAAREAACLWDACEAGWNDESRHDAFLAHCQRVGAFAFAASRYRSALAQSGGNDPTAAARLTQVRTIAELALMKPTRPAGEESTPYKGAWLILVLAFLALLGGVAYGVFKMGRGGRASMNSLQGDSPPPALGGAPRR